MENNFLEILMFGWKNVSAGQETLLIENYKKNYDLIFGQILDLNIKHADCMTEEETELVRKKIGVYGKCYTNKEMTSILGCSESTISNKFKKLSIKLAMRIIRGCVNLKESLDKGEISTEEILSCPVSALDNLEIRLAYGLRRMGCITVSDVINHSLKEIEKFPEIGRKGLIEIYNYIHSLGLTFKNEDEYDTIKIIKTNHYINYDKSMEDEQSSKMETLFLLNKIKETMDKEVLYDYKIAELVRKKEELQEIKRNLLNRVFDLQDNESFQKKNK